MTLRFRLDAETRAFLAEPASTSVGVLWHNQLFASLPFFRRYCCHRRPAALISASGDGAWLAPFLRSLGIEPVRGSQHRRGAQALRELQARLSEGMDLLITPDGSKGPVYRLKAGAAHLAWMAGCPVVLVVLTPRYSVRMKTWDRFHLPLPFSVVDVKLRIVRNLREAGCGDVASARDFLERRLRELADVEGDSSIPAPQ